MPLISAVKLMWQATKAGEQLANPAIWKQRQDLGNVLFTLATVLAAVLAHWHIVLSPDDLHSIVGCVVTCVMLWNKYFIAATSKTVAIGAVSANPAEPAILGGDAASAPISYPSPPQPVQPKSELTGDPRTDNDPFNVGAR